MKRFWGFLLAVLGGIGVFGALHLWSWQNHVMQVWIPHEAVITDSHIAVHRGKNTSYSPEITYTYSYGGHDYAGDKVTMFNESSTHSWANAIVDEYPVGSTQTAFIDPDHPSDSILLREYSLLPYILLTVAAFATELGIGLALALIFQMRSTMLAVPLGTDGSHLLLPTLSLRAQLLQAFWWWSCYSVTIGTLAAHFHLVARIPGLETWIVDAVILVAWFLLSFNLLRRLTLVRKISDPRIEVTPIPSTLGDPLTISIEFDAKSDLQPKQLTAALVCIEHYRERRGSKTQIGTRIHREQSAELLNESGKKILAREILNGTANLPTLAEWPFSWDAVKKVYPYYTWELRATLKATGMPIYKGTFPLDIRQRMTSEIDLGDPLPPTTA